MSAVVKQDLSVKTNATAQPAPSGLMQMSIGPAALAQHLIYEIMALYAKVTGLNEEQRKAMVEAQATDAKAEASATISAAYAFGIALAISGALSIAGAVAGFVSARGSEEDREELGKLQTDTAGLEKELSGLKALDKIGIQAKPQAIARAHDDDEGSLASQFHSELEEGTYSQALKEHMESEDFNPENPNDPVVVAVSRLKHNDNVFDRFMDKVASDKKGISQDINSKVSQQQIISNKLNMMGQTISTGVNSLTSIAQGAGNAVKGDYDAKALINRMVGQMAGSASQESGQNMSKSGDAQNNEVQTLDRIRQSGSANGG